MNRLELAERIGVRTQAGWIREAFVLGRDNFRSQLLRLVAKADPSNRERLRLSFPVVVAVFEQWEERGDELLREGGFA